MSISVIIPTCDPSRPLKRAIDSAFRQLEPQDEIIVVGDTFSGPLPTVEALCRSYGPQVFYMPFGLERCFGHPQIDAGASQARGEWITFQDDDDIYTATAFASMRHQIKRLKQPQPLLFRFVTHFGLVLWEGRKIEQGWIGGHALVCPNIKGMIAPRGRRYEGDFDMVKGTVERWKAKGVQPVWCDDIIAIARPTDALLNRMGWRELAGASA